MLAGADDDPLPRCASPRRRGRSARRAPRSRGVVGDRGAEPVAPDLVGPHLLVGAGVEQPLAVGRPGDAAPRRRPGELVRRGRRGWPGRGPAACSARCRRVSLDQASSVWSGEASTAWTSKKSWPLRLGVAVEDHVGRCRRSARPRQNTGYDWPSIGAGDVPPRSVAHRHRLVGLLHPRLDLGEHRLDEVGVLGRRTPRRGRSRPRGRRSCPGPRGRGARRTGRRRGRSAAPTCAASVGARPGVAAGGFGHGETAR